MKEWRWYMSEDDGTWEILCNADCPEEDSDLKSANGREAVIGKTRKRQTIRVYQFYQEREKIIEITKFGKKGNFIYQLNFLIVI